jgi:hypothetical protein
MVAVLPLFGGNSGSGRGSGFRRRGRLRSGRGCGVRRWRVRKLHKLVVGRRGFLRRLRSRIRGVVSLLVGLIG